MLSICLTLKHQYLLAVGIAETKKAGTSKPELILLQKTTLLQICTGMFVSDCVLGDSNNQVDWSMLVNHNDKPFAQLLIDGQQLAFIASMNI